MSEQDRFDDLLRSALRRVEPPAGLEGRILRAAGRRRGALRGGWLRAAAMILIVLAAAGFGLLWRQERARAERAEQARRELEFALQLTYDRLAKAERQVNSIGVRKIRFEEVPQ
jgi:hypothetical protein